MAGLHSFRGHLSHSKLPASLAFLATFKLCAGLTPFCNVLLLCFVSVKETNRGNSKYADLRTLYSLIKAHFCSMFLQQVKNIAL